MTVAQELTPMTPEQQKRIFEADGEMMTFKGGWGASVDPKNAYMIMGEKVRKKLLAKGAKVRKKLLSFFETGRPYRPAEIHDISKIYKNVHTTRNSLNRLVKEGHLVSERMNKRMHYIKP